MVLAPWSFPHGASVPPAPIMFSEEAAAVRERKVVTRLK